MQVKKIYFEYYIACTECIKLSNLTKSKKILIILLKIKDLLNMTRDKLVCYSSSLANLFVDKMQANNISPLTYISHSKNNLLHYCSFI